MSTYGVLKVVVQYEDGGITDVSGHESVDVVFIDWSGEFDYDVTEETIRQVLDAGLDGPKTFDLIKRLIKKYEEFTA